ncbi:MAG: hypothetical protein FWD71_03290 [Oscillospiraceae bacterium]|nr:hypothetical protein [Oscillospiraceae bacterium]
MFYEEPYMEFVNQEAIKIGKYFLLDSGEGREFIDSETGWHIEDLSGYLIDPSDHEKFIVMKKNGAVDDYFLKDYVFAIWGKNTDGSIKITFEKYQFYKV